MMLRNAKSMLLALVIAGCGSDQRIAGPEGNLTASRAASMADGRTVTSLSINGSVPPTTLAVAPGQSLIVLVTGFTTFAQTNPQWLSTSITFTPNPSGTLTTRCDETDVWTSTVTEGSDLAAVFMAMAPSVAGNYLVTVTAHQEHGCSAVNPSAPFPAAPDNFTLLVGSVQNAPVLAPIGPQSVAELSALTFSATATDADGSALTFSLGAASTGTFPSGATITSSGAFSWTPAEDQGPGTYRAKVTVSDGSLTDEEEIDITVSEANAAPELTLPSSITSQWGLSLPNANVTATDSDLPANTLTFSKVSGPSWITVDAAGSITFGNLDASSVGTHTVRIRVTDNGSPSLFDEEDLTINVQNRPVAMTYHGRTSGQYSDKSTLSATLVDNGVGPLTGTAVANATVAFALDGIGAGSGTTDASGSASTQAIVSLPAGSHVVTAQFTGGAGYASGSVTAAFAVSREEGALTATHPGSSPVGTDLMVTVSVRELLVDGAEPVPNDGALPGNIGNVAAVAATIRGVGSGMEYQAACGAGSGGSSSYTSSRTFICTFAGASLTSDVYMLQVSLPTSDGYYHAAAFEAPLSIWDLNGGTAAGGGSFMLDGDRVTFAFHSGPRHDTQEPRSELIVIRHLADGGICRLSSIESNPGVIVANRVSINGKGTYVCISPEGNPTASADDVNIWLIAEDHGTPGAGLDWIWISNNAPVARNMLDMRQPAQTYAALLTSGNVKVQDVSSAALRAWR